MHRRFLTFRHWSGVSPYTSSYELAGTCVFDKQSLEIFSCGPARASTHQAGLIPKLRPLFCRVPYPAFTRSPWSTRPVHLFRFCGTVTCVLCLEVFLGPLLMCVCSCKQERPRCTRSRARSTEARIFQRFLPIHRTSIR